jgi:hypothetical protein
MLKKTTILQLLVILLVVGSYFGVLSRNLHESERRSLQLKSKTQEANYVFVSIQIVGVDTSAGEMTARIRFRLAGNIANDEVTPAVNLKLLLNSSRGTQEFEFPKGERLRPIEAVFSLDGNVNSYPFDKYESNLWMLITVPTRRRQTQVQPGSDEAKQELENAFGQLTVGTTTLQKSEAVPIRIEFSASVPRVKFEGKIAEISGKGVEGIALRLTRADNVIFLSVFVMVLMMSLAMSVLFMAASVLSLEKNLDLPLSLGISLIFGLPALRNVQPGVPPVGVIGDYLSFLWAENIVGISAVMIMFAWLRRTRRPKLPS